MRLWIAAAEASGDALAAELVAALRARHPGLLARGMAGARMRAAGVEVAARAEDGTALGLIEVLGSVRRLSRLLRDANAAARAFRPDVAVTVDSPGLMLRHARALRRAGIPVAHWVAPQVWAWRPGRAAHVDVDSLLCLFPFEPELFHAHGVRAIFTGHPAVVRARPRLGPPSVVLAPGSRAQEIRRHAPVLARVAARMRVHRPDLGLRVAVVPGVAEDAYAEIPGERLALSDAAAGAVVAIAASGTVTLELAALGVPMVVIYQVHPFTWAVGRLLVRGVRHLALPNVLAGRPIVPEHLQALNPDAIARDALAVAADGHAQRDALAEVVRGLGGAQAVSRAADEVERLCGDGATAIGRRVRDDRALPRE